MKFSLYEIIRVSFKLTSLIAIGNYQGFDGRCAVSFLHVESVLFFKLEIFSHNIAINKQINTSIIEMQIYWQRSFYILSIVCKA